MLQLLNIFITYLLTVLKISLTGNWGLNNISSFIGRKNEKNYGNHGYFSHVG